MTTYYHIYSSGLEAVSMEQEAYTIARQTWLCTGCLYPKPGHGPIDATLEDFSPGDWSMSFVNGCGLPIARKDMLACFGDARVRQDLQLGRVVGPDGTPFEEWVTFRGRHKIIVRGTKNVAFRQCEECGRNIYFAMGSRYLYPDPPLGSVLLESDLLGLVMPEYVFDEVDIRRWKGLAVNRLPVLSKPKDGLVELISFQSI